MYDKHGEFDSYVELNTAAAKLKEEGDEKALMELTAENGIPKEDAEDYYDGTIDTLCTPLTAAIGKLDIEIANLKPKDIMEDWSNYIRQQLLESENMQIEYRRKSKSLKKLIGELLKWSFNHQQKIDIDIIKAAGISGPNAGKITIGIPGMGTAHKIIKEYLGGK